MNATAQIFLAMGIGTIISALLQKTGMTFPPYIGAMFAAAILRNISDATNVFKIYGEEIDILGNISLSLFLAMALMALQLWQLADLALPLVVMLFAQTMLMALFAYFVTFNLMGRDYEAAVIASANCGFGMGATPNAMANMGAIVSKFGPAPKAFFIVPLVGSLFIDFFNAGIITIFMNFFVR
jgi:ESS family glutamate:Na+ symporter